jgi:hypothetical protein
LASEEKLTTRIRTLVVECIQQSPNPVTFLDIRNYLFAHAREVYEELNRIRNKDLLLVTIATSPPKKIRRFFCCEDGPFGVTDGQHYWGDPSATYPDCFKMQPPFDEGRVRALQGIVIGRAADFRVDGPVEFLEKLEAHPELGASIHDAMNDESRHVLGVAERAVKSNATPVPYKNIFQALVNGTCGVIAGALSAHDLVTSTDPANTQMIAPHVLSQLAGASGDGQGALRYLANGEGPRVTSERLILLQLDNVEEDMMARVTPELFRGDVDHEPVPMFLISGFPSGGGARDLLTTCQILTEEEHSDILRAAKAEQRGESGEKDRHALRGIGMLQLLWMGAQRWFVLASHSWKDNPLLLIDLRLLEFAEVHVFRRKDRRQRIAYRSEMKVSLCATGEAEKRDFDGPKATSGSGEAPANVFEITRVQVDDLDGGVVECVPTWEGELFDLD